MYRCFKKVTCSLLFFIAALFADDDSKILEALSLMDVGKYTEAIDIYYDMYKSTKQLEYLQEVINISVSMGEHKKAVEYAKEYEKFDNKNIKVKYALANSYMSLKDIDGAIATYRDILSLETDPLSNKLNHRTLGNLLLIKRDLKLARKHLIQSYNIDPDSHTLILIVSIDLYSNDLESSKPLIQGYFKDSIDNDFSEVITQLAFKSSVIYQLESLYEDYYNKNPNQLNANNLFRIYVVLNRIEKALELSKKHSIDDNLLIDFCLIVKDYNKARTLVKKAINGGKGNYYYGVLAIIDFEEAEDKTSVLDSVIRNFKIALSTNITPIFSNYLGYLLIDYDVDINAGIKHVQDALKYDPNNPAYLDSLAWGYYKIDKCDLALDIINKISKETIQREGEIGKHLESIQKCLKQ